MYRRICVLYSSYTRHTGHTPHRPCFVTSYSHAFALRANAKGHDSWLHFCMPHSQAHGNLRNPDFGTTPFAKKLSRSFHGHAPKALRASIPQFGLHSGSRGWCVCVWGGGAQWHGPHTEACRPFRNPLRKGCRGTWSIAPACQTLAQARQRLHLSCTWRSPQAIAKLLPAPGSVGDFPLACLHADIRRRTHSQDTLS